MNNNQPPATAALNANEHLKSVYGRMTSLQAEQVKDLVDDGWTIYGETDRNSRSITLFNGKGKARVTRTGHRNIIIQPDKV